MLVLFLFLCMCALVVSKLDRFAAQKQYLNEFYIVVKSTVKCVVIISIYKYILSQ
jgi:hypothetical protein